MLFNSFLTIKLKPQDEKVTKIIKITSVVCAGLAIQPIPFADIFILTPMQGLMGSRIAAVRGIPISNNDSIETIKQILGTIGLGLTAQQLVIGGYKTFIPFAGGLFTIPIVFGLTYGIGRVMDQYFINRSKGRILNRDELRKIFKQGKKEGKEEGKEHKKNKEKFEFPNDPLNESIKFLKTNFDDIIIITSLWKRERSSFLMNTYATLTHIDTIGYVNTKMFRNILTMMFPICPHRF